MSEESLSALLDGELSANELDALLTDMASDPSLRATASRWSASRLLIQGHTPSVGDFDIADRVMAIVAAEPLPISGGVSGNVVPLRARRWQKAFRPAAGLAAAAVVGAVVLAYVPREDDATQTLASEQGSELFALTELAELPVSGGGAESSRSTVASSWEREPANRLNAYYIDYSGHRSVQGVGGPLGYARFAAHNADLRADTGP
jgi:negative regulator of sigma E activity